MKYLLALIAAALATIIAVPALAQSQTAINYVNQNVKLVYPHANVPISIKAPFNQPDTILLRGIDRLLEQGTQIGSKGVAPEGREPAALYDDALFILTRMSNEKRGDEYYRFTRGNLNTFAGRIYLALLRDTGTSTPLAQNCNAQVNAALDSINTALRAARP